MAKNKNVRSKWNIINTLMLCLRINISFQIINFNYEIINEEFENDKIWKVIHKFSILCTSKIIVKLIQIQIWKFFCLSNNKFKSDL